MPTPYLDDLVVDGERVLVRADLNVPLVEGTVSDAFRIEASLPTIQELRMRGASVIVATHLGRPDGIDPALSTKPVAERLGELGGFPVVHAPAVIGETVEAMVDAAGPDSVVVLENTRFEAGETTNDPVVADGLARLATYFVNDAFGTAYRTQLATGVVVSRRPSAAGLLLAAELAAFDRLLSDASRPYVVVLGGAKISDKLGLMHELLPEVDLMLVGGGLCFTLLAAGGYEVGDSLVDRAMVPEVRSVLDGIHGSKVVLPEDVVVADSFAAADPTRVVSATAIPDGMVGLDIGPDAVKAFAPVIEEAERVFWNGPMGVYEWEAFRGGTQGVAAATTASDGYTVVGGGESVAALRLIGRAEDVDHLSTGGGAGLALLEGVALPGIVALERWG